MIVPKVLVLGGGPDAEREVSLNSAAGVAGGLRQSRRFEVIERTIGRLTLAELRSLPGDVVFPVLHGSFGEGGPLQDLLEADGRPYVGCRPHAARHAMDKLATKMTAARLGLNTAGAAVFNANDAECPMPLPVVAKPVHDGSSVGLYICKDRAAWDAAREAIIADLRAHPGRAYMVEPYIAGQELTVGLLDGRALPTINIVPAEGAYDYDAKYTRNDTRYVIDPPLPPGVDASLKQQAAALAKEMGVRHVARVDFILDGSGTPWLLEVNTMPGFTSHSLVPKAAAHAGMDMPTLCSRLVEMAIRDGGPGAAAAEGLLVTTARDPSDPGRGV